MNDFYTAIAFLAGIAVRLAIPVLITVVLVQCLRILDAHWQLEAQSVPTVVEKPACWEVKNCPPDRRKDCPGYVSPLPCWQAQRTANGYLREECLGCRVFVRAPVPSLG